MRINPWVRIGHRAPRPLLPMSDFDQGTPWNDISNVTRKKFCRKKKIYIDHRN